VGNRFIGFVGLFALQKEKSVDGNSRLDGWIRQTVKHSFLRFDVRSAPIIFNERRYKSDVLAYSAQAR
jgi:hypothetical protein